ncbi:hypothetical protein DWX43_25200 [Clostridium sp. AF19-22AC]|uniref:hypothetical protein n=1 Tax=Clostridia TaxID=186801 RepID=UPI000E537EC1|nr:MULTISPECIES: hypothetical protein [Clostridia]RHR20939.1 hypothetical protein DWX43_25200 [Clostridium sp. AF19-22AC]
MFYKQFLKITDVLDKQFLEEVDYWLTVTSDRETKRITTSFIASKFMVNYATADVLLKFAVSEKILEKRYILFCDNTNCEMYLNDYSEKDIYNMLGKSTYCHNCDNEFIITESNIMIAYNKIKDPGVLEERIRDAIFSKMGFGHQNEDFPNFSIADSLANNPNEIYSIYYSPEESAYKELMRLKIALDGSFQTPKEKGDALERFSIYLFNQIKSVSGTNRIRTYTNQFDCTMRFSQSSSIFPTIMKYLTPYFIIECKNELDKSGKGKTPSNTYFHKLSDIMASNEAQVGIVISRGAESTEDRLIAYNNYLICKGSGKQKLLLSLSDNDFNILVDKRVNLLEYLSFKMDMLTMNAKNATYEMFKKK